MVHIMIQMHFNPTRFNRRHLKKQQQKLNLILACEHSTSLSMSYPSSTRIFKAAKQSTQPFIIKKVRMQIYTLYAAMSWEQFLFFLILLLVPVNFQWRRKAESAFFCRQVIKSFFGNSSVPRYCSTCSTDQQPYNRNHQMLVFPDCKVFKISHALHIAFFKGACIYRYTHSYPLSN